MQEIKSMRWLFYCLTAIWAAVVTYASLKAPSINPPPFFLDFENSDKLVHFTMYFGLCFWIFYSTIECRRKHRYAVSLLASVAYGIVMEVTQEYMAIGRSMDVWDALANATGATSFLLLSVPFDKIMSRVFPRLFAVKTQ